MLFCKEEQVCWNTVESQYYAAENTPTKGGRVQTKTVCCHCYSDGNLADEKYLEEKRGNRGGKKGLPICKACADEEGCKNKQASASSGQEEAEGHSEERDPG